MNEELVKQLLIATIKNMLKSKNMFVALCIDCVDFCFDTTYAYVDPITGIPGNHKVAQKVHDTFKIRLQKHKPITGNRYWWPTNERGNQQRRKVLRLMLKELQNERPNTTSDQDNSTKSV